MSKPFDADKFITKLEGLGASFTAVQLQDGSCRISRKFKRVPTGHTLRLCGRSRLSVFPNAKQPSPRF